MLPAVITAGRLALSSTAGRTLTTIGLFEGASAAYDWMFGDVSQQEEQKELVEELIEVRKQLDDPSISTEDKLDLAQEDAEIQQRLAQLGITVETTYDEDGNVGAVAATEQFDLDNNNQYSPSELKRMVIIAVKLARMLDIKIQDVPMFLSMTKTLSALEPAQLDDVLDVLLMGR